MPWGAPQSLQTGMSCRCPRGAGLGSDSMSAALSCPQLTLCAADHVVHGVEIGDRHLSRRGASGADCKAERRSEHAADHSRNGSERSHRHADQRNARLRIGFCRRREQRQHIGPVAGHYGDLSDIASHPLRFQEALHEELLSRRIAEVVIRKDDAGRLAVRGRDDAAHVLGFVAHLEVDEIDGVVGADGVVETDDALVVECVGLAALPGRPPREDDRRVAGRIADRARNLPDRRRVRDAIEIVDTPLDDVGPLRDDARRFGENAFARPSYERSADQGGFPTQFPAPDIDDLLRHAGPL